MVSYVNINPTVVVRLQLPRSRTTVRPTIPGSSWSLLNVTASLLDAVMLFLFIIQYFQEDTELLGVEKLEQVRVESYQCHHRSYLLFNASTLTSTISIYGPVGLIKSHLVAESFCALPSCTKSLGMVSLLKPKSPKWYFSLIPRYQTKYPLRFST